MGMAMDQYQKKQTHLFRQMIHKIPAIKLDETRATLHATYPSVAPRSPRARCVWGIRTWLRTEPWMDGNHRGGKPSGELTFCHGKSPFHGKIHYFDWAIFHGKMLVHQRVSTKIFWGFHQEPLGIYPKW